MTLASPASPFNVAMADAQAHVDAGRWGEAVAALERAVVLRPAAGGPWRALGDARLRAGDPVGASAAHGEAARLSLARPPLSDAITAIAGNRLATAEGLVRARLKEAPSDVAAIGLLADLALRAGNVADATRFLRHALAIAPDYTPARSSLARAFHAAGDLPEALAESDQLLAGDPKHPGYRNLRAATLDGLGDQEGAAAAYRAMLAEDEGQSPVWMTLGNVLKSLGDIPGAIGAFRRSLALAPDAGESWWALANLKSYRFDNVEVAAMEAALKRPDLGAVDRIGIAFAQGKACEDRGDHAAAFAHYGEGNRLQLARAPHDPNALATLTRRSAVVFTAEFFAERAGSGDPRPDPIFIVGLPRSGSTLLEQMLASHPAIEGTMELPELPRLVRMLGGFGDPALAAYPDSVARLSRDQLAGMGAEYLRRAGAWRRTARSFFIDKRPLNFMSVGLIRLILPNARIIDMRRHPLGCGWSVFRQHFAHGSDFATSLEHIGRFYADYVAMMALWDEQLPGLVHRVVYEDLVADPETQVRRALDFIGLPFDPACLAFHENARAVRTPSAEQVRRPLYTAAVDEWRRYEEWLGPMKRVLGDVLTRYRHAP